LYTQLISNYNILIRKVEIWYRKDQYDNVWFSTPVTIHSGLCSVTSLGIALCYCDNAVCQANVRIYADTIACANVNAVMRTARIRHSSG